MKRKGTSRTSVAVFGGERGQSLVETAVVVPVLVGLLIGAVEMAQIGYKAIQVANAAKAAVQYGAQNRFTAADTTGIQTAASNDSNGLSGLVATSSVACICANSSAVPSSCSDNTTCFNANTVMEETLTVSTSVTFNALIHGLGLPSSVTLHSQAAQRVLN